MVAYDCRCPGLATPKPGRPALWMPGLPPPPPVASYDNLECSVDDVIAEYVAQCALSMTCRELALAGLFLAAWPACGAPRSDRRAARPLALPPWTRSPPTPTGRSSESAHRLRPPAYAGGVTDPAVEPVSPEAPALTGPGMMNQAWRDLTFLHWAVDPERVAHRMPPGVRPDTIDGATYVGLIPFRMVGAGVGRGPGVPWLGTFLETNVRLYSVDETGRRGIVFLSLDADRAAVVLGARAAFGLPYRWARMRYRVSGDVHTYDARLRTPGPRASSHIAVRAGARRASTPLDDFLSARWGLHVRHAGRDLYVPNHHEAWPMHDAEVVALDDGLMASVGLPDLAQRPPDHVGFSPGVLTEFGLPGLASRPRRG